MKNQFSFHCCEEKVLYTAARVLLPHSFILKGKPSRAESEQDHMQDPLFHYEQNVVLALIYNVHLKLL